MGKLCVLGMGYIGLPTASMFATHGYEVVGVDVNRRIVDVLSSGEIHIEEPGLKGVFQAAMKSGCLRVSLQPELADAFIIAVPTPFLHDEVGVTVEGKPYKKADMQYVVSAAEAVLPFLRKGNLVILESTSPPCTTEGLVKPILERSGLVAGQDFYLAYSPERVLPGQILKELVENDRVIGGINDASSMAGRELYAAFVKGTIVTTDATTAEMVKLMENTYRDINIAIANEFSRLANRFDVDIWEAISIANRHPRVKILNPGPGVGGHCISVDPWFFVESAPDLSSLIHTARQVNDSQPEFVLSIIERSVGNMQGKRVAVLGLAYKPDVDDLRESPAIEVAKCLVSKGAEVVAYEPFKPDAKFDEFAMAESVNGALQDADLIVVLVGHSQFKQLVPQQIRAASSAKWVFDTVGVLRGQEWEANGFQYQRLNQSR